MYHYYHALYFTTATILNWQHLLQTERMKAVVLDALHFLVREKRAVIYAFVIMPNHLHLVWHIPEPFELVSVKASLLSYKAHQFRKILIQEDLARLEQYRMELSDRQYQFWQRNALSIPIYHDRVFWQKVNYIHWNPCTPKWKLAERPEQYLYSSAYLTDDQVYWAFVAQG